MFNLYQIWSVYDYLQRRWERQRKMWNSRFEPPFGGLRGNVHGSSMAHWKARGWLRISANWTFVASYHGWGTMSGYWSKSLFRKGGGHCQRKFQEERGDQVADLSNENFKSSRVMRWWFSRLSSRFGAKSSRERKPKWLPCLEHSEREKNWRYVQNFVIYWL